MLPIQPAPNQGTRCLVRLLPAPMRASLIVAALMLPTMATATGQFELNATVQHAAPESTDGRFQIEARVTPGQAKSRDARFSLTGRVATQASDKAINAACGSSADGIFLNGFEN